MSKRTHVILDIAPRGIDPGAWAEVFEQTSKLLSEHPSRLLGYDWKTVAGVALPVHTRAIEPCVVDDPAGRRWCVTTDRDSLRAGEPQMMYRDIEHYLARVSHDGMGDILLRSAREPVVDLPAGCVRVFGDGEQAVVCVQPLLAAAMLIETRFPEHATVHGHFDRGLAEGACRWADHVLHKRIPLPVRLDGGRLIERLRTQLDGEALVRAVDRLLVFDPDRKDAELFHMFARAADPWWLTKLRAYSDPESPGALHLFRASLEAKLGLAHLTGLACVDARGPRYAPKDFAGALAVVRRQMGLAVAGKDTVLERALSRVFGNGRTRIAEAYYARLAALPALLPASKAPGIEPEIDQLTVPRTPGDLSPAQRHDLDRLARLTVQRLGPAIALEAALPILANRMSHDEAPLTEGAWTWMASEKDPDILRFLAALAATRLGGGDARLTRMRRVLFESPEVCRLAATLTLDAARSAATGVDDLAMPAGNRP